MWKDLADQEVQMDILVAAAAGQSVPMCAYSGGVKPAALYAALKDGHSGDSIYSDFSMMFYQRSSIAQREVLESAKLKPDIWLSHTKDTYIALASEHAHDLVQELEEALADAG